jgi:hypothetical protein
MRTNMKQIKKLSGRVARESNSLEENMDKTKHAARYERKICMYITI